MSPTARRRWIATGWTAAVTATVVNGVVVGYGAVWLQFFGDSADAEDYRISAGGYGAAALVLALAVVGMLTHPSPRSLVWVAAPSSIALVLLAARSLGAASTAAGHRASATGPLVDGIGSVLWAPWTWALLLLGLRGLFLLGTRRC